MDHPFLPGLCERILQQTAAYTRGSWWPDGVLAGSTPSPHHHLIKQHIKASSQPPCSATPWRSFSGSTEVSNFKISFFYFSFHCSCLGTGCCYSVANSCPSLCDPMVTKTLQHVRLPSPSLSSGVCSNSCLLHQWCYLNTSSSATLFSFCLQSFPTSGTFPMSRLITSGGQSIGGSASASVIPMNI